MKQLKMKIPSEGFKINPKDLRKVISNLVKVANDMAKRTLTRISNRFNLSNRSNLSNLIVVE